MTGGQSVDTGNTPPQTGDFSQTGPGTIDTDEVDPVAEADVYMAYGRDTQAEEILLEALQKDPQRTAIHGKLLEIYANRRSLKQFETLASELYAQTSGVGAEWEKVAALGAELDPSNPLYSGSRASMSAFDANATMIVSAEDAARVRAAMSSPVEVALEPVSVPVSAAEPTSFDLNALVFPEPTQNEVVNEVPDSPNSDDLMSLDFDLGSPQPEPEFQIEPELVVDDQPVIDNEVLDESSDVLDFDLGNEVVPSAPVEAPVAGLDVADELVVDGIDFDLNVEEPPLPAEVDEAALDFSPEGTMVMSSPLEPAVSTDIDFDAALDSPLARESPATEEPSVVDFDLELDLLGMQAEDDSVSDHSATETLVDSSALHEAMDFDDPKLAETIVNAGGMDTDSLEFDVKLTDSVFLGQPMMPPEFDMGAINLDLAVDEVPVEPVADVVLPVAEPDDVVAEAPAAEVAADELPVADALVDSEQWEEVNTKLDLAKAYEEMGDLEGARELLEEVVGEGPADLVEQAQAILDRIGE